MPTTTCEQCGKEFNYRSKGKPRRFCSTNCAYPNRFETRVESNCPICGDPFIKIDSSDKNARRTTCGKQKCQKSRKNHPNYTHKVEVTCQGCGDTFFKTSASFLKHTASGRTYHYCSNDCKSKSQSSLFAAARIAQLVDAGFDPDKSRLCIKCNQPKPLIDFLKIGSNICKTCLYEYQSRRWTERKKWAIAYLGGKCVDCGYDKHWVAFDFHHRDPEAKEFDWSKLKLRSKDIMIAELDKCDLLCCICHRIRHLKVV